VVVKGKERGDVDAFVAEDLIERGVIEVVEVEAKS